MVALIATPSIAGTTLTVLVALALAAPGLSSLNVTVTGNESSTAK